MRNVRLNRTQGIEMLEGASAIALMSAAHEERVRRHGPDIVTYVVDTNPNYTNACITDCSFCSFYRKPGRSPDEYLHSPDEFAERVGRAWDNGATTVLLQGGHHPNVGWNYLESLIKAIQRRAPRIHVHPFSPSELIHAAGTSGMALEEVLERLWDLGVRTIPGGGAEILVDSVRRRISPKKIRASEWLDCMRLAHRRGFMTSATMTYGHVESSADVLDHLLALRSLQDETGGFYAFIPWSFKPGRSPLSHRVPTACAASHYVRIIAISRLVLDNVDHIQASWFGEGARAGQLALQAGADDFGGVLLEENVLRSAGHSCATNQASVVALIEDCGFSAIQRTTKYEHLSVRGEAALPGAHRIVERDARGVAMQVFDCEREAAGRA